jgi:hypothetical protein
MSLWSKLVGTISTTWQLGLAGPIVQNNSGAVEARNAANSAFVIVRGLTPVGANDLVTKAYADSGGGSGAVDTIRFALGTGASQSSVSQIPANATVVNVKLDVTTAYSGGCTITLGQTGTAALLQATTDNLPTQIGIYECELDQAWGASALAVLATIAGAPSVGVAAVIVQYSATLA